MGRWDELIPICEDIVRNDYGNITYGKIVELTNKYLDCELDDYVVDISPIGNKGLYGSAYSWDERRLKDTISVDELATSTLNVYGTVFDDRKRGYSGSHVMCESGCISFIEWCKGLGNPGIDVLIVLFLADVVDRVVCCGVMGSDLFFSRIYGKMTSEKKKKVFRAFCNYLDLAACLNFDRGAYTDEKVDEILKKAERDFRNASFGKWLYEDLLPSSGLFEAYSLLRGWIVIDKDRYKDQILSIVRAYNYAKEDEVFAWDDEVKSLDKNVCRTVKHYLDGSFVYYDWVDWLL